jgi:predicted RNA-binding protein with PIN domain
LRSGTLRSSNLTLAINSIPNYGAVIDKVEVFNSVEIRVATSSKNTDDAIRGYTAKSISGRNILQITQQSQVNQFV